MAGSLTVGSMTAGSVTAGSVTAGSALTDSARTDGGAALPTAEWRTRQPEPGGGLPRGYSVVVPVYRGRETLPLLVERLEQVLPGLGGEYEIVLVNDGSPDDSWSVIVDLARKYPAIRGISLMRNYGQHNATLCGLCQARFDVTITNSSTHPSKSR